MLALCELVSVSAARELHGTCHKGIDVLCQRIFPAYEICRNRLSLSLPRPPSSFRAVSVVCWQEDSPRGSQEWQTRAVPCRTSFPAVETFPLSILQKPRFGDGKDSMIPQIHDVPLTSKTGSSKKYPLKDRSHASNTIALHSGFQKEQLRGASNRRHNAVDVFESQFEKSRS